MAPAKSRKQLTHERIVSVAARAIRRSGYAGTGVADIMGEAGLTHGGFYAHFESREALLEEAVEQAGRDSAERLDAFRAARVAEGASPLRALIEGYLADAHRRSVESGCVVAALASEMPRQLAGVRAASVKRVHRLVERVREALPPGVGPGTAETIASTLVGALMLARSIDDDKEAATHLRRVRRSLLERYDH